MLEKAMLETQLFKNFWGSMPPEPPRKLALVGAPLLQVLDPPLLKTNTKSSYYLSYDNYPKESSLAAS